MEQEYVEYIQLQYGCEEPLWAAYDELFSRYDSLGER